jgi:glutamyl-tRNA reductase
MTIESTHIAKNNINSFWAIGINYKKSDASVRGVFAVNTQQYDELIEKAGEHGLSEFFILSTCNRTEIYGIADSAGQFITFLCSVCAGGEQTFREICYAKNGSAAIEHLFNVAAGLDSQILGDYEILGQIKNAAKHAKSKGCIGAFTERLINSVLQASKAIKTHTALSGGTVSVSFAAIQYIRDHFHNKAYIAGHEEGTMPTTHCKNAAGSKKTVLVGTGKIGTITCRNLVDYLGSKNITVINRTRETAEALASELKLRCAPMENLAAELIDADIILVSTAANEPIILSEHLKGYGDKLVIDLSIPCNVDTAAQTLPNVTFVNVDTLSKIKDETLQKRRAEVPKAEAIIKEHVAEFEAWCDMRRHVPVLKEVKNKLKEIYIAPGMMNADTNQPAVDAEKIQKVLNALANKMRQNNNAGCNYIEAINDFIG